MVRIIIIVLCILFAWFPAIFKFPEVSTVESAISNSVQPADSPAATNTPAPTPVPTADPAATPWMNEEDTAALNHKIDTFLRNEGDYTPEKISAKMFDLSGLFDKNQLQLGLVDATHVEGYFFDYIEKDKSLILLVGFDGADGVRFVAPIQIPLYYMEGDLNSHFYFKEYNSRNGTIVTIADITQLNTTDLNRNLYQQIGGCIAFAPARIALSGSPNGYMGAAFDYFVEHNEKLPLAEKLMLSVATNEEHIAVASTFPQLYDVIHGFNREALEGLHIPHITKLEDLGMIDMALVPMIDPVIIYLK